MVDLLARWSMKGGDSDDAPLISIRRLAVAAPRTSFPANRALKESVMEADVGQRSASELFVRAVRGR